MQVFVGQVLVQHGKIVAEVQEGLHRIRLWESSSADMVDFAFGEAIDSMACLVESPAKVYLFIVGEEPAVEPTGFPIIL